MRKWSNVVACALSLCLFGAAAGKTAEKPSHPAGPSGSSTAIRVAVVEPVICRGTASCNAGEWSLSGQTAVFALDVAALGIPVPNVRVLNTRFDCVDHCSTPSPSVSDLEVLIVPTPNAGVFETPPVSVRVKAPGMDEFRERWLISIMYLDDNASH